MAVLASAVVVWRFGERQHSLSWELQQRQSCESMHARMKISEVVSKQVGSDGDGDFERLWNNIWAVANEHFGSAKYESQRDCDEIRE